MVRCREGTTLHLTPARVVRLKTETPSMSASQSETTAEDVPKASWQEAAEETFEQPPPVFTVLLYCNCCCLILKHWHGSHIIWLHMHCAYAHLCCGFDLGARCVFAFSKAYHVLRCSWNPCWICCPPSEEQALRALGLFWSCRFSIVNSSSSDFKDIGSYIQKRYRDTTWSCLASTGTKAAGDRHQDQTKSVAVGGEAAPADLQWARMLGDWQEG